MMSPSMLVSIIIPCYNQAHFLGEAIESALAQTYPRFEIIVVDDGSTDNTNEVAASYPGVHCVQQRNQGLSAARNTGLHNSTGEYIVFLDADDRILPNALHSGLDCLKAYPESAFGYGRFRLLMANGTVRLIKPYPFTGRDCYSTLLQINQIGMHATVMYRRAVFDAVCGFNRSLRACEDY
jgi:glycosyltransferase involved in cell wall biosynthesis